MVIHDNKFYRIEKTEEGCYTAEFKSEALSGVAGFNFKLEDTVEERMRARANVLVSECLFPKDIVSRRLKANVLRQDQLNF
jgi:hypothetical protein